MFYFKSRVLARSFAKTAGKFADQGAAAATGRRWAVKVL